MRRILNLIIIAVIIFLTLFSLQNVSADLEPNNSLDNPEVITEGTINGNVATDPDSDEDIYLTYLDPHSMMDVVLTNKETQYGSISLSSYDEDKMDMGWNGLFIYVSTAGESGSDKWANTADSRVGIYMKISGYGNYSLTVEKTQIQPVADSHSSFETAQTVHAGMYTGHVQSGDYGQLDDDDYFKVVIPENNEMILTIKFVEDDTDSFLSYISVNLYDSDRRGEFFILSVYSEGGSDSSSWINSESSASTYYIVVEGNGEYELTIEFNDVYDEAIGELGDIVFTWIVVLCGGGLFLIILILLIIGTIFFIKREVVKEIEAKNQKSNMPGDSIQSNKPEGIIQQPPMNQNSIQSHGQYYHDRGYQSNYHAPYGPPRTDGQSTNPNHGKNY